jgi:putative endonuclease
LRAPDRLWRNARHGRFCGGHAGRGSDEIEGLTKRYRVHTLVWFEMHESMESAIACEKSIKEWKRSWKLELIEADTPAWRDLSDEID